MTHGEACRVRACVDCGASGAGLYKTTRGENPGRLLRLCQSCLRGGSMGADWGQLGLVEREPLPLEDGTEEDEVCSFCGGYFRRCGCTAQAVQS